MTVIIKSTQNDFFVNEISINFNFLYYVMIYLEF